jgi:hypothetical protein
MPRIMRMGANGESLRRRAWITTECDGGGGALREQGGVTPPGGERHPTYRKELARLQGRVTPPTGKGRTRAGVSDRGLLFGEGLVFGLGEQGEDQNTEQEHEADGDAGSAEALEVAA